MTKLLVVAGTADGAAFIAAQPEDTQITATTFSQLGAACLPPRPGLKTVSGALDEAGFARLIAAEQPNFLVDLSHPFAVEVSANAKAAAQRQNVPYLRYERETAEEAGAHVIRAADFPSAVAILRDMPGNILLTVGSKTIPQFMDLPDFHTRVYMRVLAESRILRDLEELNIDPAHIFAMKGVATAELNIALAHYCNASVIVSKDSGKAGGLDEKLTAARTLGIPLLKIERPKAAGRTYASFAALNQVIYNR